MRAALEAKGDERMEFSDLKRMFTEAGDNKYPESELLEALQLTVEEAEKCQMVAQQLCGTKGKVNHLFNIRYLFKQRNIKASRICLFYFNQVKMF